MNDLKNRILELSYRNKLSHIGSCLTAVDIIDKIYSKMNLDKDKFVLSQGHAGLALYVVLEKYGIVPNAQELIDLSGTHPDRLETMDEDNMYSPINCSTGSLGLGLPIAVGMALADQSRMVYCLISDGECAEGSIWESLRIIEDEGIQNIEVHLNVNGYSAYKEVRIKNLPVSKYAFIVPHFTSVSIEELGGIAGHYKVLSEEEYQDICQRYKSIFI